MHIDPAPKREAGSDRRMAIASAARALVAEKGFEGLRTRDIADRVGINIATLHYHVPTKEALIGLLAQSMREEFIAQHFARPREGLSPLELLRLEFIEFTETLDSELIAVFSELIERSRRDPAVRAAMGPMQGKWKSIIQKILEDGVAEGQFRPDLDPEAGAQMVFGALTGFARSLDRNQEGFARLALELERALLHPSLKTRG
jgi:AcrR family transcriptional regulator